ncbi:MAG: prolyl oligopeptidase family serine peptidase [Planctomycetes bacterium]|nr:prolyl oligopeptidase family serine peptidase [Planctomycetota bacterium]
MNALLLSLLLPFAALPLQEADRDAPPAPPRATSPWRVEDLVDVTDVGTLEIAPDGMKAIYTRLVPDAKRDRRISRLWLADLALREERPLTSGAHEEFSPCFNEDGKQLAFLSTRPPAAGDDGSGASGSSDDPAARAQVWLLRMDGGEPTAITALPEGVVGVQWASKTRLVVAARERLTQEERTRRDAKDRSVVVEEPRDFAAAAVRLFEVTLGAGDVATVRRLTTNVDTITTFAVAPDGDAVAALASRSPQEEVDGRVPPRAFLLDVATGAERELFAAKKSKPSAFAWSAEGDWLYAAGIAPTVDGENMAGVTLLWEVERASGFERSIDLAWERGLQQERVVPVTGGFVAALADGVAPRFARFTRGADGRFVREWLVGSDAARLARFAARPGIDTVLYHASSAADPGRWCVASLVDQELRDERPVALVPPRAAHRPLAKVETLRFAGANGDEVEALLWHPIAPADGTKRPLLLLTHGGPHANDLDRFSDRWSYPYHRYAARGCYVLAVNYHGSSGYGRAFAESIKGRYYELELVDLVKGIEQVAARYPVDRERLGCLGWSNGAILSIGLTALLPDVVPDARLSFKVCVAGAGDVNWTSDYGNCRFGPAFDDYYLGGPPWRESATYLAKSPLFHAERVTTPTLIQFGGADTHVPTSQGWEWYRALQQIGKAPVRFVLFPDEPHGLQRLTSQRRKLEEEFAFVDRHLFGAAAEDATDAAGEELAARALREGSPLWSALQAEEFARVGDAFGEPLATARMNWPTKERALPLPEVVEVDGLSIGRFEVTRAQWRAFRPDTEVAAGDENLPIAGIALEEAQGYVAWLSETTGERWRLPWLDELEPLAQAAAALAGENTFERWLGFAPRPEEEAALQERARRELGERAKGCSALLWPVGSGAPLVRGAPGQRAALYDLGGNVAEWALARADDEDAVASDSDANHAGMRARRPAKEARAIGGCALMASDAGDPNRAPPATAIGLRVVREAEAK